ncbi:MAG: enoyl-CoA hydratase-related protein [Ardenticatenaceae bacterium]|nr:enoyl-CoA hydratase-related protein [Ardenticatenaceae bacterium]
MAHPVAVQIDGAVATVTVNRPEVLNAIDGALLAELEMAFATLEADEAVRVVILTGAGDRAFIAGGDIAAMRAMTVAEGQRFVYRGQAFTRHLETSRCVIIAAVNGYALGGGTEIALACDIRLAAARAQFGLPEVTLGIFPGWGGTQRLPRLVGKGIATELITTGARIDAQAAHRIGLVNHVVPDGELLPRAHEMAVRITANGPLAVRQAKLAIRAGLEIPLEQALILEAEAWLVNFATADRVEGLAAFLERRRPVFRSG